MAWDPFLTSTIRQSGARVLTDGSDGLASYKRYYLASADYAAKRGDVLNIIYGKLVETGKWVKANPAAARTSSPRCGASMRPPSRRPTATAPTRSAQSPQPASPSSRKIADAFLAERVLPAKVDTSALAIWTPKAP